MNKAATSIARYKMAPGKITGTGPRRDQRLVVTSSHEEPGPQPGSDPPVRADRIWRSVENNAIANRRTTSDASEKRWLIELDCIQLEVGAQNKYCRKTSPSLNHCSTLRALIFRRTKIVPTFKTGALLEPALMLSVLSHREL
jgi:hypothetical protein